MTAAIKKVQNQPRTQEAVAASAIKTFTPAWLRPAQAAAYLGFSRATLYRKLKDDPTFPRPYRLGEACSVLNRDALDQWVFSQPIE